MPLVGGHAISYSPLMYRPRGDWERLSAALVGDAVLPKAAAGETALQLDAFAQRIDAGLSSVVAALSAARVETLVVLIADRGTMFDDTNTPQVHVFVGDEVWGDVGSTCGSDAPARYSVACDPNVGARLADELAHRNFDIAESRGAFRPQGNPARGAGAALIEPAIRLLEGRAWRIVPVHVNCHVDPCIRGDRMVKLGASIAEALAYCPERIALIASGGMSGERGDYMAGWIDEPLDRWVIDRLLTRRSQEISRIFDVESLTLRGSSREFRLWATAGAAMEQVGAAPALVDYFPFHRAAAGTGIMNWSV